MKVILNIPTQNYTLHKRFPVMNNNTVEMFPFLSTFIWKKKEVPL